MAAAAGALGTLAKLFGGIFGQHHAKAVKNEADALNYAVPAIEQSWNAIIDAVNSGQLDINSAIQYLNDSLTEYENQVYNQFGVKRKDCNGPCVVEKALRNSVANITSLLRSGKPGQALIERTYGNAGYTGTPEYYLQYNGTNSNSLVGSQPGLTGVPNTTSNPNVVSTNTGTVTSGNSLNLNSLDLNKPILIGSLQVPIWSLFLLGFLAIWVILPSSKE